MNVELNDPRIIYSGRIDFSETKKPCFIYPSSFASFRFYSTGVKAVIHNQHQYFDNYIGGVVDGVQSKVLLNETGMTQFIVCDNLEEKEHEVMLFKRMDACHWFTIEEIEILHDGRLLEVHEIPKRRMEFYGDSVTAGEVSEAIDYVGQEDPPHNGEYSNSWYSYAWITARKLNARIHNISQGGIALLDNTGWFNAPNYKGMESTWDKINYNGALGEITSWDFKNYTPHVVIVALGQNDSHPDDYMKESIEAKKAVYWREHYKKFVLKIRSVYPNCYIILTTTILNHHVNWDKAIEQVCLEIKDDKVKHFLYTKNGNGTPGHIRISEAEYMADELANYINSLEGVWSD